MKKEWLNPEVKNLGLEFTYDDEVEIVEEEAIAAFTPGVDRPQVTPEGWYKWKWICKKCKASQGGFGSWQAAYDDWKYNHRCGNKTS